MRARDDGGAACCSFVAVPLFFVLLHGFYGSFRDRRQAPSRIRHHPVVEEPDAVHGHGHAVAHARPAPRESCTDPPAWTTCLTPNLAATSMLSGKGKGARG